MEQEAKNSSATPELKQFVNVHRIYVKASSFEAAPMTLELPSEPSKINLEVQLNNSSIARDNELYEASLILALTGRYETNLLWRLQLQEAGLFTIKGFAKEQIDSILNIFCMNMIYPYACNAVYQAVVQAGFQPIFLGAMNFEMLYQEKQKKQSK